MSRRFAQEAGPARPQAALAPLSEALAPHAGTPLGVCSDALQSERRRDERAQLVPQRFARSGVRRVVDDVRELTRRALVYTFARARQPLSDALAERLVAAWDALSPWPEANATLIELKHRGYAIALLSNGDEAMLRAGCAHFDVAFDHVFASDQAGFYKPHPAIYALPLTRLGLAASDMLHVAGSGNDAAGAKLAGLRCAWSNRAGEPMLEPDARPDHEMRDLAELLAIL